jgi:hypothetical protein
VGLAHLQAYRFENSDNNLLQAIVQSETNGTHFFAIRFFMTGL